MANASSLSVRDAKRGSARVGRAGAARAAVIGAGVFGWRHALEYAGLPCCRLYAAVNPAVERARTALRVQMASLLRSARLWRGPEGEHARAVRVGLNARLDTLQCAVLLAKLEVFEDEVRRRRAVAHTYDRLIGGHVRTPVLLPWNDSAWAHYTIEVDRRDDVQEALRCSGVPTRLYYRRPLHMEPAYADDGEHAICPIAERAAHHVLSLPMHPYLETSEQIRICDELLSVLSQRVIDRRAPGTPVAPETDDGAALSQHPSRPRTPARTARDRRTH